MMYLNKGSNVLAIVRNIPVEKVIIELKAYNQDSPVAYPVDASASPRNPS